MNFYIKTLVSLLTICLFASCTKEISVDVNHEPKTIIYGQLNNGSDFVSINIQQSVPLNSSATHLPINDATVMLYSKNTSGDTNLITDSFTVNNGNYTSNAPVNTIIGNSYWIEVILADGTKFNSKEELLKPVINIDGLSIDNEDVITITFNEPENDSNFYTFKVELFNNGELVSTNLSQSNDVIFNGNPQASVDIDLFKEVDDDIEDEEDNFIEFNEVKVTLYHINLSSYQFYLNQSQQLEANLESSSGDPSQLFATPPVHLLGNITNSNTNNVELGNFTVQSKSSVLEAYEQ